MRPGYQRSLTSISLLALALGGGALTGCGGSSSDETTAKQLLEVQQAREDGRKQAQDEARQKDLAETASSLKAEVKRLRADRSNNKTTPSAAAPSTAAPTGSARNVAAASSSNVSGAPACDRGPGTLVWKFNATQASNGTGFNVRLCQTSNGSWYYGSTDSKGGGVSAVPLTGPEGAWRSTNGIYAVRFDGNTACLTVRVNGVIARGFPACGPLN